MILDLFSTNIAYAGVDEFVGKMNKFMINPLILLLFGLAVLVFLYGVVEFILNQSNEDKKTTGKSHMLWGIIGITIMMGAWTIMGLIAKTIGSNVNIEQVKGP